MDPEFLLARGNVVDRTGKWHALKGLVKEEDIRGTKTKKEREKAMIRAHALCTFTFRPGKKNQTQARPRPPFGIRK